MELFAADGHDAGGCERVTGKSGMRPIDVPDGVFPDNPETPPARAGSTRTDAPAPTWQHGR